MKKTSFSARFKTIAAVCALVILLPVLGCKPKPPEVKITVKLDQTAVSILAGTTQVLTPTVKVTGTKNTPSGVWVSDNPSVATVDNAGTVTAVAAGSCGVTYTAGGKAKAVCAVTVNPSSTQTTVMMFHSIASVAGNKLCVPAEDFDKQMKWLHDNNYATLSLDELSDCMTNKKPFPQKSVVITLDDGYDNNYSSMYPIIKKYNLHATVFMITSKIGTPGFLSGPQLREMSDSGYVSVEGHTVTHPDLDTLSYNVQLKELTDSKQTLESLLGKKVEYMAYPTGKYNKNTITAAQAAGYKMCFLMEGGTGGLTTSPYEFPRSFVDKNLNTLIDAANGMGD